MESFKIALCQMSVTGDKEVNLKKAVAMIRKACENEARIIVLPEMFICPYDSKKFKDYAEAIPNGMVSSKLAEISNELGIYLVAGSIPELDQEGKLYNASAVFGPDGKLLGKHRKMHLFDINVPGEISFKESESLTAGNSVTLIKTPIITFGVGICYDMRFPELSRLMVQGGARLIIVPAAFNMVTGPAHWEITIRTRALDNQAYICACAPARDEGASYISYANSMVADPWGRVVARAGTLDEIIFADIDPDNISNIRDRLPLLKHLRPDLYEARRIRD